MIKDYDPSKNGQPISKTHISKDELKELRKKFPNDADFGAEVAKLLK